MAGTVIMLAKSNRAVGLLNEVAEAIRDETDALELQRVFMTLESLAAEARFRCQQTEKKTRRIARADADQRVVRKSAGSRIAALCGRM